MNFSSIASAVGGFLVLVYLVWQVIVKFCGDKDWFNKRRKEHQKRKEEENKKQLKETIKEVIEPMLLKLEERDNEQDKKLTCLIHSSNDMMRAEIVKIYYRYLPYKKMLQYSRELLNKLFHDYHDQGGNSFIEDMYNEMKTWPVVSNDKDLRE